MPEITKDTIIGDLLKVMPQSCLLYTSTAAESDTPVKPPIIHWAAFRKGMLPNVYLVVLQEYPTPPQSSTAKPGSIRATVPVKKYNIA